MAGKDGTQKIGKLVETGLSVAKLAQAKAEEALRDVAHISETQRNQMRDMFEDAAKKSRESSDLLIKSFRREIEKQILAANTISKEELGKFSERLASMSQEIGKVTLIRDELTKLTEMVNSLVHLIQKSETTAEEPRGEKSGTGGDEKPATMADADPPKPRAARTRTPAKPKATTAEVPEKKGTALKANPKSSKS